MNIFKKLVAALVLVATAASTYATTEVQSGEAGLRFVGADVESVIKAVGLYTNITFIIDPRVKGLINLVSDKPVSKTRAFELLSSALRLQGFAIVVGDGYVKVVPETDAKLQPVPTQIGTTPARGDQIVTQVFRLNYEAAANLVTVLRPLITSNNTINATPGNNSLIITDYADNVRRLGKIVAALDVPTQSDVDILPMRYAIASDVAVVVNKLMDSTTQSGATNSAADGGRVVIVADPRSNSILIRAPSLARANLAKSLIEKMDQPTLSPGNIHVVYLKNADAAKLAQTLRAVVAGDSSVISNSSPNLSANGAAGSIASSQGGLSTGGGAGFIQADPATNALIITASEAVYRNMRAVIDLLDVRRAQIYIESLIVEVSADKAAELGIQWLGVTGDNNSKYRVGLGDVFSSGGNNIANLAAGKGAVLPGNGLTLGIFRQINGSLGLGALARALESDASANILSVPNLITLDNEEAKIIVGQNVPFITGQYAAVASGNGASVNPFQTIERKDVGLSLRVRPQVSEGGTIKMAIYQESSSVQNSTNAAGIITNKRSIETNVLADDGQIIVLGGLIEDTLQDGSEKVNGLADLPLIGGLFKYRTRSQKKTNLMVFLRPIVLRNSEQSAAVVTDRYDYIRGVELNTQPEQTGFLRNVHAPTLPRLELGQPVGDTLLKTSPSLKK